MRIHVTEQVLSKILKYCKSIEAFMADTDGSLEGFENDVKCTFAVSFAMQQIGEDAKFLSPEFILKTRDKLPWGKIKEMRNMYAHEYERMETSDIYSAAITDIPHIKAFCEEYLKSE